MSWDTPRDVAVFCRIPSPLLKTHRLLRPTDFGLILHVAHLRQTTHLSTTGDHPSNNDCSGDPVTHQVRAYRITHSNLCSIVSSSWTLAINSGKGTVCKNFRPARSTCPPGNTFADFSISANRHRNHGYLTRLSSQALRLWCQACLLQCVPDDI